MANLAGASKNVGVTTPDETKLPKNDIMKEIRACKSRDKLMPILERISGGDKELRIKYLNDAMYNPMTFFSNPNLKTEETYELTIQVFLSREWELHELYKKMGLASNRKKN
jgi:hypothetical protein